MRVAIIGIASRFAAELVELLVNDPDVSHIVGVDRVRPKITSDKIHFCQKDVRDPTLVRDLRDCDALVHLAFIFQPPIPSLKEVYSINIDGSRNVFRAAIEAGVPKIVYASSVAAYGAFPDNPIPLTEAHPLRLMHPEFYYNTSKFHVERLLDEVVEKHERLAVVRIRSCTVTGRYASAVLNRRVYLTPSVDVPMQFVWIDDIAQAFLLSIKKEVSGIFNIAGDHPLTWREIGQITGKRSIEVPYRLSRVLANVTYELGLQKRIPPGWLAMARYPAVMDCTRAKTTLGWTPRYDTAGAIAQLFEVANRAPTR